MRSESLHSLRYPKHYSVAVNLAAFCCGILLTAPLLNGDAQGLVNLLLVLFLFALFPAISLLISAALLLSRRNGVAAWLLNLPFWPSRWRSALSLSNSPNHRRWLFMQSQFIALSFASGTVIVYLLMLLATDISFVWRSTLLTTSDLAPLLELLARPWWFWSDAQPNDDLLRATQDFRTLTNDVNLNTAGQWWRFILAAQVTYNLIPRGLMAIVASMLAGSSTDSMSRDRSPLKESPVENTRDNRNSPYRAKN